MDDVSFKSFLFGVDISPWWFLQKVENGVVHYIYANGDSGRVVGCKFIDVKRKKERVIAMTEMVSQDMLYREEPKRVGVQSTYRHYPSSYYEGSKKDGQSCGSES